MSALSSTPPYSVQTYIGSISSKDAFWLPSSPSPGELVVECVCVWVCGGVLVVPNVLRSPVPLVAVRRVLSTQSISCSLREQKRWEFN